MSMDELVSSGETVECWVHICYEYGKLITSYQRKICTFGRRIFELYVRRFA